MLVDSHRATSRNLRCLRHPGRGLAPLRNAARLFLRPSACLVASLRAPRGPGQLASLWPGPPRDPGKRHGRGRMGKREGRREGEAEGEAEGGRRPPPPWRALASPPARRSRALGLHVRTRVYHCRYRYHRHHPPPPSTHNINVTPCRGICGESLNVS